MPLSTDEIMALALELAGMTDVPGDSRIYHPGDGIRRMFTAIDITRADLAWARHEGFDAVLAHHPPELFVGDAFLTVLDRHGAFMRAAGVPKDVAAEAVEAAKAFFAGRRRHMGGSVLSYADVDRMAREAGMPLLNIHQPCDELGRRVLQQIADRLGPEAPVRDFIQACAEVPEIAAGPEAPELAAGRPDAPLGRVVVAHAAGTNGGVAVARALFGAGVGTVVYIHVDPAHAAELRADGRGNLVVTGHYGSDSIGINPLLDALEQRGLEVTSRVPLVRVRGG